MTAGTPLGSHTVWDRVVCAIDLSTASVSAAKLATRLMPPGAALTMCTVLSPDVSGEHADAGLPRQHNLGVVEAAHGEIEALHAAELHLREGPPIQRILEELHAEQATLVTLGASAGGSAPAPALGHVAAAIVGDAPCSVLIAHDQTTDDGDVVVGFDGSGGARRALAAGRELADRLAASLRVLIATGDPHPPGPGWSAEELESGLNVIEDPRPAIDALADAGRTARLLILGSRHLHGVVAQSSVSEAAASRAHSPVLILR